MTFMIYLNSSHITGLIVLSAKSLAAARIEAARVARALGLEKVEIRRCPGNDKPEKIFIDPSAPVASAASTDLVWEVCA